MALSRSRLGVLAGAATLGLLALAAPPAQAWWRGGVWVAVPPVVVAPPLYAPYYPPAYYPPAYYPPVPYYPPAAYPPPSGYAQATPVPPAEPAQGGQGSQVAYGATCYAGVYVCQAPANAAIGAGCSCAALGAPSYGTVH